jgi:hypothetical protein
MSLTQFFKELNTINRDKTTFSLRLDPVKEKAVESPYLALPVGLLSLLPPYFSPFK